MEHTYAEFPGLPVLGTTKFFGTTQLPANIASRVTAGFFIDFNAEAELLEGTGRSQHGSGVKIKGNESGWDLHVDSGSAVGALNIDECERS